MSFTATCHPSESHTDALTFTAHAPFKSHVTTCRKDFTFRPTLAYKGKPVASIKRRAFAPKLGEVGSWVTMSDGTVGQVWSTIRGGAHPKVWVATGTKYRDILVSQLRPAADPAEQLAITPEPAAEPVTEPDTSRAALAARGIIRPVKAPEPVLAAAIESGHAMIVPVGFSAPSPEPSPEPVTCQADSGSATDCQPVCDAPATREVTYTGYRGPYVTRLCDRHADQESARVYPETVTSDEPVTELEPEPSPEPSPERRCFCPDDCSCHYPHRPTLCGCQGHDTPEPSPEPVPNVSKLTPAERKAWNRAVADLARERDQYRAVMDAWDRVTELRLAGATPTDAVSAVLGPVSNVSPIRGTA